jgi:hypothetical protein
MTFSPGDDYLNDPAGGSTAYSGERPKVGQIKKSQ